MIYAVTLNVKRERPYRESVYECYSYSARDGQEQAFHAAIIQKDLASEGAFAQQMKSLQSLLLLLLLASVVAAQQSPTRYVDPFVGTGGHGHTFPGERVN